MFNNQNNIHCYSSLQYKFNCFIGFIILIKNKIPHCFQRQTACLGRNALLFGISSLVKDGMHKNAPPLTVTAMCQVTQNRANKNVKFEDSNDLLRTSPVCKKLHSGTKWIG